MTLLIVLQLRHQCAETCSQYHMVFLSSYKNQVSLGIKQQKKTQQTLQVLLCLPSLCIKGFYGADLLILPKWMPEGTHIISEVSELSG